MKILVGKEKVKNSNCLVTVSWLKDFLLEFTQKQQGIGKCKLHPRGNWKTSVAQQEGELPNCREVQTEEKKNAWRGCSCLQNHAAQIMRISSNTPSSNFLKRVTGVQVALKAFLGMAWWEISRSRKDEIKWDTIQVRHISRKQSVAKAKWKRSHQEHNQSLQPWGKIRVERIIHTHTHTHS